MKLTLIEKKHESSDVTSFIWEPAEPVTWQAGQYLHYKLPHEAADDRGDERWFTISSAPCEGRLMTTTRFAADHGSSFKKALFSMNAGDQIEASGIEGDFVVEDPSKEYVFLAGGIGITPFHSILKQAHHDGTKLNVTLIYGNRNDEVVFKDEFEHFAQQNPNLKIHYLVAPERIDENSIKAHVPNLQTPLFYVSGPEPMVKSLEETLKGMGVPAGHIKLDDFPGYAAE